MHSNGKYVGIRVLFQFATAQYIAKYPRGETAHRQAKSRRGAEGGRRRILPFKISSFRTGMMEFSEHHPVPG